MGYDFQRTMLTLVEFAASDARLSTGARASSCRGVAAGLLHGLALALPIERVGARSAVVAKALDAYTAAGLPEHQRALADVALGLALDTPVRSLVIRACGLPITCYV